VTPPGDLVALLASTGALTETDLDQAHCEVADRIFAAAKVS